MMKTKLVLVMLLIGCAADDATDEAWEALEEDDRAAVPTHNQDNCPGGSGGRGQPERKHCTPTTPDTACLDCCYYNYDIVDDWQCRKYKKGSNNYNNCWARAILDLADCQVETCKRRGQPPR